MPRGEWRACRRIATRHFHVKRVTQGRVCPPRTGIRKEQDLFVRLIDSIGKQVSRQCNVIRPSKRICRILFFFM